MQPEAVTGTFEIHIFVTPLDPAPHVADAFTAACTPHMKGLLLELDYEGKGFVGVLQSSRYVKGTVDDARKAADEDAAILASKGFEVVRRKVEAVSTNAGVPRTAEEAARAPDRYFEFHVLVVSKRGPISNEEVSSLRTIAKDMSAKLSQPVPLSYNALKPQQRFLNLRSRSGLDDAMVHVDALCDAIAKTGELEVVKVISEYICSDDNRAIDNGWLEPQS
jgi:hypothetical protein